MRNKWKSLARCIEGILSNLAVVGIGLALYEQELWQALIIGLFSAFLACLIAWGINHD